MRLFLALLFWLIFNPLLFGNAQPIRSQAELQSIEIIKSRVRKEIFEISQEFILTKNAEVKVDMSFHPNGLKLLNSVPSSDLDSIPIENLISLIDRIRVYIGNSNDIPYAAKKNLQDLLLERLQLEKLAEQRKLLFVDHKDLIATAAPTQPVTPETLPKPFEPVLVSEEEFKSSWVPQGLSQPFRSFFLQTSPVLATIFFLLAIPLGGLWVLIDFFRGFKSTLVRRRSKRYIKICQLVSRRCLSSRSEQFSDLSLRLNQIPIYRKLMAEKIRKFQSTTKDKSLVFWLGLSSWDNLENHNFHKLAKQRLNCLLQEVLNLESEELHHYHKSCLNELDQLLAGESDAVRWLQKLSNVKTKKTLHKVVPNECIAISALYTNPRETNKLLRRFPQARRKQIQQYFHSFQKSQVSTLLNRWQSTHQQLNFLSSQYAESAASSLNPALNRKPKNQDQLPSLEL